MLLHEFYEVARHELEEAARAGGSNGYWPRVSQVTLDLYSAGKVLYGDLVARIIVRAAYERARQDWILSHEDPEAIQEEPPKPSAFGWLTLMPLDDPNRTAGEAA